MALCGLCREGLREKFVAESDRAEHVRCSNWACSYFCSLDELATYERVVQLDVARTFRSGDAPLCQHERACALRASRSVKNAGRPYFTSWERWPCTFFCWVDLEVTLYLLPNQQTLWSSRPSLVFSRDGAYENSEFFFFFFLIKKLLCGFFFLQ